MRPLQPLRGETWFTCFALTTAAIVIGYAIQINNGHLNGAALILLTLALAACGVGLAAPVFPSFEQHGRGVVFCTAAVGLAFQLWAMFRSAPGIYLKLSEPKLYLVYLGGIVAAGAIAALSTLQIRPQVWLPLLATVHFALGIWMIRVSPAPRIDLFYNQTAASDALVHARNPYTATYPDIYSQDGAPPAKVFGYPPISYLCTIPGYLAGDVRYSHLAAMSFAALLFGLSRPSQRSALVAALFLFTPRTLFVLEQGWTEPFVLLFFAAVVFCKVRGYSKLLPVALGLLIGSKQHLFLILPAVLLLVQTPFRWKEYLLLVSKATFVAAAFTVPFLLWNPTAFYRVLSNFSTVSLRTDSLSYPSWFFLHGGPTIPTSLDLLVSFLVLGFALWRMPRTPSGFAATAAVMYFVLFLFSIGSFCNYYYMVVGLLCMAVALSDPASSGSKVPSFSRRSRASTSTPGSW